jgi:hypothetical protein
VAAAIHDVSTSEELGAVGRKALNVAGAAVDLHGRVRSVVFTLWNESSNQSGHLGIISSSGAAAIHDVSTGEELGSIGRKALDVTGAGMKLHG